MCPQARARHAERRAEIGHHPHEAGGGAALPDRRFAHDGAAQRCKSYAGADAQKQQVQGDAADARPGGKRRQKQRRDNAKTKSGENRPSHTDHIGDPARNRRRENHAHRHHEQNQAGVIRGNEPDHFQITRA